MVNISQVRLPSSQSAPVSALGGSVPVMSLGQETGLKPNAQANPKIEPILTGAIQTNVPEDGPGDVTPVAAFTVFNETQKPKGVKTPPVSNKSESVSD